MKEIVLFLLSVVVTGTNGIPVFGCTIRNPCTQVCTNQLLGVACSCNPGWSVDQRDPNNCVVFEAKCPPGYKSILGRCTDVNECVSSRPCNQECVNTIGGYQCKCEAGYQISSYDRNTCVPVSGSNNCGPGYRPSPEDPEGCEDIDECYESNPPCEQICDNTRGSYSCSCRSGYVVSPYDPNRCQAVSVCGPGYIASSQDSTECEDIDECASQISPCQQVCDNTRGSYICSCNAGFAVSSSDPTKCIAIDQCKSKPCQHTCTKTASGFTCSCNAGYKVVGVTKCEDDNECSREPCDHVCTNTPGSYTCSCKTGYLVSPSDKHKCVEADVCGKNSPCEQVCKASGGKAVCSCKSGYKVSSSNKNKCENINECVNEPCDHSCSDTQGSYTCSCKTGYTVSPSDRHVCVASDVCGAKSTCEQVCTASGGKAVCSCNKGYTVSASNANKCENINECVKEPCDHSCTDTPGSYTCSCKKGFVVSPSDKHKCVTPAEGPCAEGKPCSQICKVVGSARKCSCREGFAVNEKDETQCDEIAVCKTKADIIFVFDASSSILPENFDKQFIFAKKLTRNFAVGPSAVRFAGIVFGLDSKVIFTLKDHNDYASLDKALTNVEYMNSNTYTHLAFNQIIEEQLFSTAKGGRDDAPDIVVLFTDGNPRYEDETISAAKAVKDKKALVIGLGIGKGLKMDILQKISTTPNDALEATSYDDLDFIERRLSEIICKGSKSG